MWDEQIPSFASQYRVIRYDARGYGRTESGDVEFSNRDDIAALLDHVGAPSAFVLGSSRGGIIALDFTLEYADRVDALIFAAGGIGGFQAEDDELGKAFGEQAEAAWEAKEWERLAELDVAYWVDGPGQPPGRADPEVRRSVLEWDLANYRPEKAEGKPRPLEPRATDRLAEVRVPTLVLSGDLDDAGTQAACRRLAEEVEGARLEVFPGVAHLMNLEQPERFNRIVMEFLAEVSLSGARP